MLVYTAGPITGCTFNGCTDWRAEVARQLDKLSRREIQCLSPMRHKDYLAKQSVILDTYEDTVLSSQRGIVARDELDVHRADAILVNLLGATRVSIGTMFEMAWAWRAKVPMIVAVDFQQDGDPHDHAFVREVSPIRVTSLEEAVVTTFKVLMPEPVVHPETAEDRLREMIQFARVP